MMPEIDDIEAGTRYRRSRLYDKADSYLSDKYLTKSTHLKLISPLFFSYTFYIELL